MFDNYNSLFCDVNKNNLTPTGTCIPFYKKMFITTSGKIFQCEKINHEFALGFVSEDTVKMDFDHIAKIANDYIFRFIKQCSICAYKNRCMQCVFQVDEINSLYPKCYSYTSEESFQESIKENMDYLGKNPSLYKKIIKDVQIKN